MKNYKDKKYVLYIHKFPNGKLYVGITSNVPKRRWGSNGKGYKNQPLMYRAIQKYDWNNIKHIILYQNLDYETAIWKERLLIHLFNTNAYNNNANGYNCDDGGEGAQNHVVSDEVREKMKKSQIKTLEWRSNISKGKINSTVPVWNKGKKMSEEWKALHPNKSPVRWDSSFNPKSKSVIYNDKIYPSKRKCWEENFSDISTYDNFKYQLKRLINGNEILDEKYKHFHLETLIKFN